MPSAHLSQPPSSTAASSTDSLTSRSLTPNINLPMQNPNRSSNNNLANRTWLDPPDHSSAPSPSSLEAGRGAIPLSPLGNAADNEDDPDAWNSRHPCYPHRNPHVPLDSLEYKSTRIIRIKRDYMYSGDLSPAFSEIYPEILEGFVSEIRFRQVVGEVNKRLHAAHDPFRIRNMVDAMVGALTGGISEELLGTCAKREIEEVERYLKAVNEEMSKEGSEARFVELRKTGYLDLDIQIPDPGIEEEDEEEEGGDRR